MSGGRGVLAVYARIGRAYWRWAPTLLVVAAVVFLPLGLLDAISLHLDAEDFDLDSGFEVLAVVVALSAIAATSLLGEVFYSGAVATALTHRRHGGPPSLLEIARNLDYGRLIGVDILYVLIVVVGLAIGIVPGLIAFVWLGLSGPVVEIEKQTVLGSLRRSFRLVRGRFWTVALVLIPIEVVGDSIGEAVAGLVHAVLGHTFVATWLADAAANIVLSPVFAVAAVLLTIDLIAEKDGTGPELNHTPGFTEVAV